jgi:hypothetical protein
MNTNDRSHKIEQVIAAARADAPTPATADREVSLTGWRTSPHVAYALAVVANPEVDVTASLDAEQAREVHARTERLAAELAPELDVWAEQCRTREYVGWSRYSTGPVRYADEPRPAEREVVIHPDVSGYPPDVD